MLRTILRRIRHTSRSFEIEYGKVSGNWCQQKLALTNFHQLRRTGNVSNVDNLTNQATKFDQLEGYVDIVKELTEGDSGEDIDEVRERLSTVFKHSIAAGSNFKGRGVTDAYKLIVPPEKLSEENLKIANIMDWCIEMTYASYIIEEDIMWGRKTRKGFPCWYTLDNIGLTAINDSLLMQNGVYSIIRKYMFDQEYYVPVVDLFHETNFQTALGQGIDLMSISNGKPRFDFFTRERYNDMVKYKTCFFEYKLPVELALYLAGKKDPKLYSQVANIMLEIGYLYHVHSDVQDSFDKEGPVEERGSNIRFGRCTWLAVEALRRGTTTQKDLFTLHYGQPSSESLQIVQNLYEELKLDQAYAELKQEKLTLIFSGIKHVSDHLPSKVFYNTLTEVTVYIPNDY